MNSSGQIRRAMGILVLLSVLVRGFLAGFLEFGNDEVYYWTYALYPDFSHFDHPPMLGYLIQLTSLNLLFDSEFFIRLGSIILGGLNTWLIFVLGRSLRDELTGLYAALLYNASIYAFIIAGTFILPDTPQLSFWLLSMLFMVRAFNGEINALSKRNLLLAGLFTGLALLSKYTSVFLISGVFLYVLFYDRKWLKTWQLYVSGILALLFFIPVVIWNYNYDFISFTYQSDRVGFFGSGMRFDLFFTELGGQILYNNPVNFILGVLALIAFFKGRELIDRKMGGLILFIALPLIGLFLFFSLFRSTLPHWTGPAWTSIILLSAAYLAFLPQKKFLIPTWINASLSVLIIVIILGILQVKGGVFFYDEGEHERNLGEKDVSLDMYGWHQLSHDFSKILAEEETKMNINPRSSFVSSRWFPAANIDYYLARPNDLNVLGLGSLDALHKYVWMTEDRGGLKMGMDAWFFTASRDFRDPEKMYGPWFEKVELAYTVPVYRNGKHVMNAFFYYLKGLKRLPDNQIAARK